MMKLLSKNCFPQALKLIPFCLLIVSFLVITSVTADAETLSVTDAWGRQLSVPATPEYVICSGAGCLRYLTYLQAQDRIVAVDDVEKRNTPFNARPYALANPQFKEYPLFGEFRGHDNPELIVSSYYRRIRQSYSTSSEKGPSGEIFRYGGINAMFSYWRHRPHRL